MNPAATAASAGAASCSSWLVAVAQIRSTPSIARNLKICRKIVQDAAKQGAKLVYLPEASDYIAPSADVFSLSTPLDSGNAFLDGLKEQAKESKTWLGVGIHERGQDRRVLNTHVVISPEGLIKAKYDKLHLFDVDFKGLGPALTLLESSTTTPGKLMAAPVETAVGKVGLLTCYDLRFPEHSLLLREKGADILTYPSAFTPRTGEAHWEVLLRARAIETQCFVLAPAQVGEHFPGRSSYGRAMIIDPWGVVLAQCSTSDIEAKDEGEFVLAEINHERLAQIRREMPLWDQRRKDIYELREL